MSEFTNRFANLKLRILAAAVALSFAALVMTPSFVHAATSTVTAPSAAARVSFTFDDSLASTYTAAAPTLTKYGLTGTDYAITGCIGMTKAPNSCRANTDVTYMTWAQLEALQNSDGWEVGSHTVDHDCLASSATQDPSDCQAKALTTVQIDTELSGSKTALASHGIAATDFSAPYGDYNNNVLAQTAKYYASFRGFKDQNTNVWPLDDYLLNDMTVQEKTDTVATVEAKINQAITNKSWLVLTFHDIKAAPSKTPDDYQYGTAELDQIAAYVKTKQTAGQIQSVHVNQGLVTSSTNLLANGSFNDGVADGWTTPNAPTVTKDTASNGSYPDPTNSIKLVGGATAHRLYSPKVAVSSNTTYMLKSFLNVASVAKGDIEYFIDEYDANGNWISGQYKKAETSSFVEDMNFAYTPSSPNVASADLQLTTAAGSNITAYVDNFQWFPISSTMATNLMANEGFDAGISGGWTTDDATNITADASNHGSPNNPINSVKLVSGTTTANTHLFSPKISVSSTHTYSITSYLNLLSITSGDVVGFYVDEYDASGNWISGGYKASDFTLGANNVGFTYQPTSATVKSASLQIIVEGNSGTSAYFDDVRWSQN